MNKNDLFVFSIFQILNNILIPWFIVLFESHQCFYGRFFYRNSVTVGYDITYCASRCAGSLECCLTDTMQDQFTFKPEFMYYSNCSNFLLTSYIPVMFITFTFTGFIFPALLILQDWFFDKYYNLSENPTNFDLVCSRFAKFQIDAQLNLMYIIPIQSLQLCNSKPPLVLDINQSLLTWTTSLGNTPILFRIL